jgi:anionic cell wall polymer biosynthesis LytR-Cps2A-Psr (LCP) family protein
LTGSQALAYSRIRDIGDDFGRTSRQRTVLTVLIEKAKELDLLQMYELILEIFPLLRTDMTNPQIMGIVAEVLPMLHEMEVISQRIPMDGEWSYGIRSGADVIVLTPDNFEANKELLAETMK